MYVLMTSTVIKADREIIDLVCVLAADDSRLCC